MGLREVRSANRIRHLRRTDGGVTRLALSFVTALALMTLPMRAHAASSDLVFEHAAREEAQGNVYPAIALYHEALGVDGTCERCYLALGNLRERLGDLVEAHRTYSVAIERLPLFADARLHRARVSQKLGMIQNARIDVEAYVLSPNIFATDAARSALVELAGWLRTAARFAEELAVWRQIHALANDRDSLYTIRALEIVVGGADPVTQPPFETHDRRALSRVSRGWARLR